MNLVCESPIFIFSAGWRSGSTMLQRLVTASKSVIVWGEAGGAIDCAADALARYEQMLGPGGERFKHGFGGNGSDQYKLIVEKRENAAYEWIACLNPPEDRIRHAFLEYFESVYAKSALELGFTRWGIKEVQSGIEAANFLKDIYPKAKFLFLVRNPVNCLISIKKRKWMDYDDKKNALFYYASHWKRLSKEFRESGYGLLIKYEDLIASNSSSVSEIAKYLDIPNIPQDFIKHSRADWKAPHDRTLSFWERRKLLSIAEEEMSHFGYK